MLCSPLQPLRILLIFFALIHWFSIMLATYFAYIWGKSFRTFAKNKASSVPTFCLNLIMPEEIFHICCFILAQNYRMSLQIIVLATYPPVHPNREMYWEKCTSYAFMSQPKQLMKKLRSVGGHHGAKVHWFQPNVYLILTQCLQCVRVRFCNRYLQRSEMPCNVVGNDVHRPLIVF